MNKLFQKLLLAAAPLLLLGSVRAAIDPALIGADAKWVGYADLNGLRASAIGTQLIDLAAKDQQLQVSSANLSLDLPKILATVGSVTTYGTNLTRDPKLVDGTMVFQGTPSLRKIAEGFLAQATVTTPEKVVEASGFPFSTYLVGGQVLIGFPTEQTVVVSKSRAQLLHAVAVLQGAAPSLAQTPASPLNALLKNSDKTFFFVASAVPSADMFPQNGPQARILQMAKSASIGLGENGTQTFAHVALVADSDAMADKLTKILQGVTALLSLGESNNQALTDFMNSAIVDRTGDTVTLDMSYASARLAEMIKNLQNGRRANRDARIYGKVVAEWKTGAPVAGADGTPAAPAWKTVDGVRLANGSLITVALGSALGSPGAHRASLDRVEISPMDGGGMPLVFRATVMRLIGLRLAPEAKTAVSLGLRQAFAQFSFPGEDGVYKVRIHYTDDAVGQAAFSLSVKDAEPTPAAPDDSPRPNVP